MVSESQPIAVHALAHAINHSLGNVGQTVVYTESVQADPVDELASLRELTQDMMRGAVSTLIIIEGDPAYTAPADLDFAAGLGKVALRVHLSLRDQSDLRALPVAYPCRALSRIVERRARL